MSSDATTGSRPESPPDQVSGETDDDVENSRVFTEPMGQHQPAI